MIGTRASNCAGLFVWPSGCENPATTDTAAKPEPDQDADQIPASPSAGLALAPRRTSLPLAEILSARRPPSPAPMPRSANSCAAASQKAIDDINATGGLRGERLALKFADDGCDPRKAVDVATGFVSAGVKVVIGHYCSGASIPASKVYEKAGIVQISPASTHPQVHRRGRLERHPRSCRATMRRRTAAARLVPRSFPGRRSPS